MRRVSLTEAFAQYGAKLRNKMWAYSAIANDGSIVFCGWKQFLTERNHGVHRYEDKLSRWHRPRDLGKNLWREHLDLAFHGKLPVRLIVAAAEEPKVINTGLSARNIPKTFTVREDVVGRVIEFDGDKFVIDFHQVTKKMNATRTLKYTFWQDNEFFLGYLNDYPDYQTQGYSKDELLENLKDLLLDIESAEVPFIRKVEEMAIAS